MKMNGRKDDSSLDEAVIMQRYRELAHAIQLVCDSDSTEEDKTVRIKRTFIRPLKDSRDRTFAHCASLTLQKGSTVRAVTQALLVYPAISWTLKAKQIDSILGHLESEIESGLDCIHETEQYMRLKEIKRLLSNTVASSSLRLEQREAYFERCERFLSLVKSAVDSAVKYKTYEPYNARLEAYHARQKLADILISGVDDGTLSQYCIRRYLCGLIEDVADVAGVEIANSMRTLCNEEIPDNAELAYLYHNIEVLLREYKRLMNSEWYTGQKALNSAKSMADSIHESAACNQKCCVSEFMQLIYGSLVLLKDFPREGEEMFQIIMLQQNEVSQKELCEKKLFMSAPKYYRIKKQAMEILEAILWGCSADVLFDLLL